MRVPLLILFVVCSFQSFSQKQKITVNVRYFTGNDRQIDKDSTWLYKVVDSVAGDMWKRSAYYTDGSPRFLEDVGKRSEPKKRVYFYPSGEVMARGTLKNDVFIGPMSFFYRDGIRMAEVSYAEEPPKYGEVGTFRVLEYRDASGNKLVDAGNGAGVLEFPCVLGTSEGAIVKGSKDGLWKGMDQGYAYEDIYKDGALVEGSYAKNGDTFRYTKISEGALPDGGLEKFYKDLAKKVVYPVKLRRMGVEGDVYVQFEVNKDGTISNVKTVKGVHSLADAEAERVVSACPPWTPGKYRGEVVKMRMILPIGFRLY